MANFNTTVNINPDFGLQKKSKPKTRIVKFQDGYEQRILFGVGAHQNPKIYNLTFKNLSETQSDTIESFLAGKYVCEEWTKTIPFPNRATINAVFRQVFEP